MTNVLARGIMKKIGSEGRKMSNKTAQDTKRIYSTVKKQIKELVDTFSAEELEEISANMFKLLHLTDREIKKRTNATVNLCKASAERYGEVFPGLDVVSKMALCCTSLQLPYDLISRERSTCMAFAIWVLDEVKEAGKIEELYDILPDSYSFSGKTVYDVCHSPDLIEKVTYMCEENMGETKASFKVLLDLLPAERLKEAKEYFHSELWRVIELYLKINLRLEERRNRVEEEKEQLLKSVLPFSVLMVKSGGIDEARMEALEEEETKLREWEAKTILSLFEVGSVTKEEGKRKWGYLWTDELEEFPIADPFTICAMFHILQYENDDLFWAMGPSVTLFHMAALRLPWNGDLDNQGIPALRDEEREPLYELKYKGGMFEGSVDKSRLINDAQLIYHLTDGAIMPRKLRRYEGARLILKNQGIPEERIDYILEHVRLLAELSHQSDEYRRAWDDDFDEDAFDDTDEEESASEADEFHEEEELEIEAESRIPEPEYENEQDQLTAELQQLREENKRLRTQLHAADQHNRKIQKEYRAVYEKTRGEHKELTDLRTLVFNQQNGEFENETEEKIEIEYPYTARHTISIFGGHDSWSKAIKPLFNNVRFIGRDVTPHPDVIKNSDVVWIQTNSMSHTYFYKVIDVVRQNNFPVRYFAYASARKCAEQIVLDDLN